jgi:hypothetical protein
MFNLILYTTINTWVSHLAKTVTGMSISQIQSHLHQNTGFNEIDKILSFIHIYISYLRPKLEYASIVWDNCTQYEKETSEKTTV